MICLNLLDLFGDKYKITIDRDSAEGPRDKDPWLQQIRCHYGLIYPYSATHLAIPRHPGRSPPRGRQAADPHGL
jgi:hypothetical protein